MKTYPLGQTADHVKNTDWSMPVCEKCFRNVNPDKAIRATLDESTFELQEGWVDGLGSHIYIGKDCWKKITKGSQ